MTGCTSPRMPFANWVDSSPEVGSFKSFLENAELPDWTWLASWSKVGGDWGWRFGGGAITFFSSVGCCDVWLLRSRLGSWRPGAPPVTSVGGGIIGGAELVVTGSIVVGSGFVSVGTDFSDWLPHATFRLKNQIFERRTKRFKQMNKEIPCISWIGPSGRFGKVDRGSSWSLGRCWRGR